MYITIITLLTLYTIIIITGYNITIVLTLLIIYRVTHRIYVFFEYINRVLYYHNRYTI